MCVCVCVDVHVCVCVCVGVHACLHACMYMCVRAMCVGALNVLMSHLRVMSDVVCAVT